MHNERLRSYHDSIGPSQEFHNFATREIALGGCEILWPVVLESLIKASGQDMRVGIKQDGQDKQDKSKASAK
jgi:hypothetical protein